MTRAQKPAPHFFVYRVEVAPQVPSELASSVDNGSERRHCRCTVESVLGVTREPTSTFRPTIAERLLRIQRKTLSLHLTDRTSYRCPIATLGLWASIGNKKKEHHSTEFILSSVLGVAGQLAPRAFGEE
jgi:hypothetical protein